MSTSQSSAAAPDEPAIDPDRPIIDPHQHFWDPGMPMVPPFFVQDMAETIRASGHNVTHTVFVECRAMYRQDGPDEMKVVGETEFVNGQAAMSASGRYGPSRLAAGIMGGADLRLGTAVRPVLEAHVAAGGSRFRGIRVSVAWSEQGLFGHPVDPALKDMLLDGRFREGVAVLEAMGLALDIWCTHPQLADLADLAKAFPRLAIVLDHIGSPLPPRDQLTFAEWREGIRNLAQLPNVRIKLGGLGMDLASFGTPPLGRPSAELADQWRPYVETCIDAFSPSRSMFESNYPPDGLAGSYGAIWNAFKRISQSFSDEEKDWLFRRTAADAYRLQI